MIEIIQVNGQPPESDRTQVLALGKFDGVHIGHQEILRHARQLAQGTMLSVMSFWPHPAFALAGKQGYDKALTPEREQARILESLGVQRLYRVKFDRTYAQTTADSFVFDHLAHLSLSQVVVGVDYRFGHGGQGTVQDLEQLCRGIGVPVHVVDPIVHRDQKVSSSHIRQHLAEGRVEAAEALLGRPYTIVGTVTEGKKLGRQIGFPTANLSGIDPFVLPASGVYAVAVERLEEPESTWFGVLNAGVRPTVDGTRFQIEVYLLDFSGDLYGSELRVSFLHRLRDEKKFAGIDELKAQIAKDVIEARDMFGGAR